MKSVLIIADYFGRWPEWIDVFLRSCAYNPSIDWLIHTDCPLPSIQPDNVRFVQMSFDDYCQHVSERLGLAYSPYLHTEDKPPSPLYNNLGDLRPCYADLYPKAIKGYDYFGWCDIDLVFGNLRRFLTPSVLEKDLVTLSSDLCCGHFTLLKNQPRLARMYRDIPQWRQRLQDRQGLTPWDDSMDEAWLSRLCSPNPNFREQAIQAGVAPEVLDAYRRNNAFVREWNSPFIPWGWVAGETIHPEVWFWSEGEVRNWRDGERVFPYLHFLNFKAQRCIDLSVYGLQRTWGCHCPVDPAAHEAEVIRIDRNGIHGLTRDMATADQNQLLDHMNLARQLPTEGLTAQQALLALRPAGVELVQSQLVDRAGVLSVAHRASLWHERRASHATTNFVRESKQPEPLLI